MTADAWLVAMDSAFARTAEGGATAANGTNVGARSAVGDTSRNNLARQSTVQVTTVEEEEEENNPEEQEEEEEEEDEESMEDDDSMDLANYGPTTEEHRAHVRDQEAKAASESKVKQYKRKVEECVEFANAIYKDDAITVDRVFKFLQFQAHREQRNNAEPDDDPEVPEVETNEGEHPDHRPNKRQRRTKTTKKGKARKYVFDVEDYKKVMDHIRTDIEGLAPEEWVPWNRLQSIEKCYNAMLWASTDEMSLQIQQSKSIKTLKNNVNARTKMKLVMNDENDLNKNTEKFRYPELYELSEGWLWEEHKSKRNWKHMTRSFRDRYTLLMTTQTCTRHEATLSCMLQSFEVARISLRDELQKCEVLSRCIYKGKTNQENSKTILQAKSIRHKHAHLCEQGALAMYLFCRFRIHEEEFDLSDNKKWMKVKTTVAVNNNRKQFSKSRFRKMGEGTYYRKLETVFKFFGYAVSHVVHFGRSCAPVLLEFAEVVIAEIAELGCWDMKTYHKAYSLNLPWGAMRAAAGFRKDKGFYRVPRSFTPVPDELKRKVFPNVEQARLKFMALPDHLKIRLPMAWKFLRVMDHLAGVFVQDVCALRYHGRTMHQMYTDPFFQDPSFISYEETFRANYTIAIDPRNDPTLDPIKKAAPMMAHHLGDLKAFTHLGFRQQNLDMSMLRKQQTDVFQAIRQHMEIQTRCAKSMYNVIGTAFRAGYQAHLASPMNLSPLPVCPLNGEGDIPASPVPAPVTPATNTRETATPPTQERTSDNRFPIFDRLDYDSVEKIHDDWFGENNSEYSPHNGLKTLCNNKDWRKSLGNDHSKREADKKMLQKMKYIGDYMATKRLEGSDRNDVIEDIKEVLSLYPKTSESLTGIAKVLKCEAKKTTT